jgi:serine/threonine protein kinase
MLSDEWPQAKGVLSAAVKLPKGERTRFIASALPGRIDLWDKLLGVLDNYDQATRISPAWTGGTTFNAALAALKSEASPQNEPLLKPGVAYGPYRVLNQIGAGGMGQVFLATDQRLNRRVAIKSLAGRWRDSPTARERLMREARAAAALSHPHIATLYDVIEESGLLVMEYVDGRPASVLLKDGPLALGYAVRLALQIAEAVSYAHDHGIVHCDIKPANVHVTKEATAKVLDFGLARARFDRDDIEELAPGQLLGTPGYMAPERLMHGTLNAAGDVYSLGVTMFELVTGRRPFEEDDLPTMLLAVLSDAAPKASSIVSEVPADLDKVIARALAADPAQRYQSARELCRDLRSVLASIERTTPNTTDLRMPVWQRRLLMASGSLAGAIVAAELLGFVSARAFETALRIDPDFTVGPAAYLSLGTQAMFPFVVNWALAAAVFGLLSVALRSPLRAVSKRWSIPSASLHPVGLATTILLLGSVATVAITWSYSALFAALFALQAAPVATPVDVSILSPASGQTHFSHGQYSAYLSFILLFAAWRWFPRLERRSEDASTIKLMKWATVAVAVVAIILAVFPRRLIWDNFEEVVFENRPSLVIATNSEELLLFATDSPEWMRRRIRKDAPNLLRTGITRRLFERPSILKGESQ